MKSFHGNMYYEKDKIIISSLFMVDIVSGIILSLYFVVIVSGIILSLCLVVIVSGIILSLFMGCHCFWHYQGSKAV
jgi:hypothetical protein